MTPILKTTVCIIVDDDPEVRKAIGRALSAFGYTTHVFDSADAFLSTAATSKASCLVVDSNLSDIFGMEMVRQLMETGFTSPIIFMTGRDDEIARNQATQLGCVDYLRKPFSADRLIAAIVKAIGQTLSTPSLHVRAGQPPRADHIARSGHRSSLSQVSNGPKRPQSLFIEHPDTRVLRILGVRKTGYYFREVCRLQF